MTAAYGWGILGLAVAAVGIMLASLLKGRKLQLLDQESGAAKQHAKDVKTGMDAAVEAGDDQAVQDALLAELAGKDKK